MTDAGLIGRHSGNEYLIQDGRKILGFYAAHREDSNAALPYVDMVIRKFLDKT
ncbi:MAG: hypothetical protein LUG45_03530 [Clostridiales bacterium]|nr:hypothetical protein [Clostridiales bacterium]